MRSAVWSLLLWTAVLACAGTACAQKTAGGSSGIKKAVASELKANAKRLYYRDEEEHVDTEAPAASAKEMLDGANVTGTYVRFGLTTKNFGPSTVDISDSETEFKARDYDGMEHLDVTTGGRINLKVSYNDRPAFYSTEYTLISTAFKGFDDIKLVKNTLPDGCKPTISDADDLENEGTLKIYIPDFLVHPASTNKVQFELEYQLVPGVDCEYGYNTPCCSKHGKLHKNGTVCWRSDVCMGAVCNGVEATCPDSSEEAQNLPDDIECSYDPLDKDFMGKFSPFITPRNKYSNDQDSKVKAMSYKPRYPKDGVKHAPCKGKCKEGSCELDRSKDGCCTLTRRKRHAYAAKTAAAGTGGRPGAEAEDQVLKAIKGGVLCWEGNDY